MRRRVVRGVDGAGGRGRQAIGQGGRVDGDKLGRGGRRLNGRCSPGGARSSHAVGGKSPSDKLTRF